MNLSTEEFKRNFREISESEHDKNKILYKVEFKEI